jgi:hypothetical protein
MVRIIGLNNCAFDFPDTLNAIASGTVNIEQDPSTLLTVGLRSGTNKIGQVDAIPQVPTTTQFSFLGADIDHTIGNGVWTNDRGTSEISGGSSLNLIPEIIAPATTETNVVVDIRLLWLGDGSARTTRYHTLDNTKAKSDLTFCLLDDCF